MDSKQRRKAIYALRTSGFEPIRETTHGLLWRRKEQTILLGRPSRTEDPRGWKNLCAELRRYGVTI